MISSINISLSGLQASEKRLSNSANNVANQQSTLTSKDGQTVKEPFVPQEVTQSSLESGGVVSDLRDKNPASIPVFDPSNSAADSEGITQYPNVDLAQEVVEQKIASYDFKANLKAIKVEDENLNYLLNIKA